MNRRMLLPLSLLAGTACAELPSFPGAASHGDVRLSIAMSSDTLARCGTEVPIAITVQSLSGRPIPQYHLNFRVLDGGGSVFAGAATTNTHGEAREIWTLGEVGDVRNTLAIRAVDPISGEARTHLTRTIRTESRIVFASTRALGSLARVYSMRPDGSGIVMISPPGTGNDEGVAVSSTGRVAFVRYSTSTVIWTVDLDGGNPVAIATPDQVEPAIRWSPDGGRLAFASHGDGQRDLWTVAADGFDLRRITHDGGWSVVDWSPDGLTLAAIRPGPDPELITLGPDGDNRRPFPYMSGGFRWSPDGRHLVHTDGDAIFIARADGTGSRRLVTVEAGHQFRRPAFSPDGRSVIAEQTGPGSNFRPRLVVVSLEDPRLRPLTDHSAHDLYPEWSRCA
jgi:hypothetical protein